MNVRLALLRHAPTEWNESGRVQGRADLPLSAPGRDAVRGWVLPSPFDRWRRVASPLQRARETAALLRPAADVAVDDRLTEMHWGEWEGRTLADLRAELGDEMIRREVAGLDFRAPGGESPREVQARLQPFLADVAAGGEHTLAIVHKGVVRAIYSLATGWDMTAREPDRLRHPALHLFELDACGTPTLLRFNIALSGGDRRPPLTTARPAIFRDADEDGPTGDAPNPGAASRGTKR